jgi:preprotein translocase subunit SecY
MRTSRLEKRKDIIQRASTNHSKNGSHELKSRLLFVIGALIVLRTGSFVPIPGVDTAILSGVFERQNGTIIEMFNMFSGGSLSRASIFALGIMPYISSSIIMQLMTMVHPKLVEIKKEGQTGRDKINNYTRCGTLFLGFFQATGIAVGLPNLPGMEGLVVNPNPSFYITAVISLVTGTMFLMWLGEQITEKGMGNGISVIIFAGIAAGLPEQIANTMDRLKYGNLSLFPLILCLIIVFSTVFFVVFFECGQRRILVNYARRQQNHRLFSVQSTHLPLKVNMAGVMPAIFSSSIILFPATIASWFGGNGNLNWLKNISTILQPGRPAYIMVYTATIIFFCFFYTGIVFSSKETADNLKKSGAFVPGIRPGEQTGRYLDKVMKRLTLAGALYICLICLIPEFFRSVMKVPFHFGGTSLLIVVVVIIDFISQTQTIMMSSQYESVLKKSNLKGKS